MKIEALSDQICQFAVKMENLRNMANLLNSMIYSESDEIDFLAASRSLSDTVAELAELRNNEIEAVYELCMSICREGCNNGYSV